MSDSDPTPRTTRASVAAHTSWARTKDRTARTAAARDAQRQRYLDQAREFQGPDATPEAVEQAAEHLRQADLQRMALASVRARRAKAAARRAGKQAGAQLNEAT